MQSVITMPIVSPWIRSDRCDAEVRPLADRHYNRQSVGAKNFVPPGRCLVLKTACRRAFWVTSYPYAEYTHHAWAGAWVCSAFRSEGAGVASELIVTAVAATLCEWQPPPLGMITFLDRKHVKPVYRRGEAMWGYTWIKAGFEHVGETKGGLMAFQLLPERMPTPLAPIELAPSLFGRLR